MPKIGLEVHQRLSGRKLFCHCPTTPLEEKSKKEIKRRLNLTTSEIGELDIAARFQQSLWEEFTYHYSKENACLVELDEEPPHPPSTEALETVLAFSLSVNAEILPYLTFMRKIILDGSNVTGFQRTGLVALSGKIETSKGSVEIETICLEEESAGKIEESVFSLDRLGIPLIEIATAPEIKDGDHAKETAEKIGLSLRAIGGVERGIGTIRQDLNVSVEGGARVEIKGCQELNMIPLWVDKEIERQRNLLKIIEELKKRDAYSSLRFEPVDVSEILKKVEKGFIPKVLKNGVALALRMPKHKGMLGFELTNGKRYGSELADYARMAGVGGLIHGDENLEKYSITKELEEELRNALKLHENDSFILILGPKEKAEKALKLSFSRAKMDYVPKETRKALPDGNTAFLRPLPGKSRMYPETDIKVVEITKELIERAKKRVIDYDKLRKELEDKLGKDFATKLMRSKHLHTFFRLSKKYPEKILAKTLTDTLTELKRKGIEVSEEEIEEVLELYKNKKIGKKAIPLALELINKGKREEIEKISLITGEELKRLVEKIKDIKKIMKMYGIRVEAEEVMRILRDINRD